MPITEGWALRTASCHFEGLEEDHHTCDSEAEGNGSSSCSDLADALLEDAEDGAASASRVIRLAAVAAKRNRRLGVADPEVNKLARYRSSKTGKTGKNASRDFHRFVRRDGRLYPVKINTPEIPIRLKIKTKTSHGRRRATERLQKYPCIYLSSWMEAILTSHPAFLLGGCDPSNPDGNSYMDMFGEFWDSYRKVDPSHPVFSKPLQQQKVTIPVALQGDEGRGLGRTPVLILSYQVIIPYTGPNTLNSKKHSFTTRLLFSVMPSTWYAKDDATIDGLHQAMADDLHDLFHYGVNVQVGTSTLNTFYAAVIGAKGDWPWVRKAFHLSSGFRSARVCHLCPSSEWWNVTPSGHVRCWIGSVPSPFKATRSPLRDIPGCDMPTIIKPDLMHNFNLGFGGDLCASGLFTLCELKVFPGRKLQARLDFAHDRFESWCGEHHKTPQVKSFDKKKFKYKTKKTFPQGTGRAHDTALLCKWLHWELDQLDLGDYEVDDAQLLELLGWTLKNINSFFSLVHKQGIFMTRAAAMPIVEHGFNAAEGFAGLASLCTRRRLALFRLRPKLHLFTHTPRAMEIQLESGASEIFNPLSWACWSDEDYVGKTSRIIRRLNAGNLVAWRCISRCLMKYKRYFEKRVPRRS